MHLKKNSFNQKYFAGAILVVLAVNFAIGGILLPQRQAQAVWATLPMQIVDYVLQGLKWVWEKIQEAYHAAASWISAYWSMWDQADTWYQRALKVAWQILKRKMLDMLVDDIILWINGGGAPRAVTDWQGFVSDAFNQAGGQFVDQYLGLGFLCQPFQPHIQFTLSSPPRFTQRVTCTLDQIGTNIQNFFNDFTTGGWRGWITLNETQNNFYGAYLMSLDEQLYQQIQADRAAQNKGIAGTGFLGEERCVSAYSPEDPIDLQDFSGLPLTREDVNNAGLICTTWTTYTPGKIAAETTAQAVGSDMEWLIAADEWQEYLGAIIDAIVNRAFKEGVIYLQTGGGASGIAPGGSSNPANAGAGITSPPSVSVNLEAYQDAVQNIGSATALVDQLELYGENLNNYLSELQTNLSILNQIRAAYLGPIATLQQMIQAGCSLPAGVTQTFTGSTQTSNCNQVCPCTTVITENYTISSPDFGSFTEQKIITQQFGDMLFIGEDQICSAPNPAYQPACMNSCMISATTSFNFTNSPSTPIDGEIANVTNQINTVNSKISQLSNSIFSVNNYVDDAGIYIALYERVQQGQADAAQLPIAEDNMWDSKNAAVDAMQQLLDSTPNDFQSFLQQTQSASMLAVQNASDAQMTRGVISDCENVQSGTYYAILCSVQATQNRYINDYNDCLAAQQPIDAGLCLESSTYVLTPEGGKKISELKKGDKVYSLNHKTQTVQQDTIAEVNRRPLSNYGNKYYYIYFAQEFYGEQLIKTTYNHNFYANSQYQSAQNLKVGDYLLDSKQNLRQITKIVIVENFVDEVWDIDTQNNHNFFAQGILVQGDSLNKTEN